jgi:hypothetical protein
MSDRFPLPDWFPQQNPWAPWMPGTTPNGAPMSPATAPASLMPPTSTANQDDSLSFHHGGFNWVETPNGGLLAVHPNGNGVDWVETPSGGLLAYPNQQAQPAWTPSAIPEHLDSARYWGVAPSPASAQRMPGNGLALSPVPQAPSWDHVPTHAAASAAQIFAEPPSPTSWSMPASGAGTTGASSPDESAMVQDAFRAAAERMRRRVQRSTTTPDQPPVSASETEAGEPGLIERTRLNGVDSFYRGTLLGAGRLALMQHYASTPDEPGIDPQTKRWRDQLRRDYPQVIADLTRYDQMRGSDSASEYGAALLGQLGGGLPTPESLIGVGAKGASTLRRLGKAGLQQGAANLAIDPVVQGLNIKAGAQEDYDPLRTAMGAGLGLVTGAAARSAAGTLGLVDGWKLFTPIGPFTRAEQLAANRARGYASEQLAGDMLKRRESWHSLSPQVTLRTQSSRKIKMDFMGLHPPNDQIGTVEVKGSDTARVRKSQRETHEEIEKSGATVVGKGKPAFPGGTVIPPTKTRVVRPWEDWE